MRGLIGGRRVRAVLAVLAVVAAVAGLDIVAAHQTGQLDLSADRRFSLSPESRQLARTVRAPLRITVFLNGQGAAARDARFLLARYHELNARITYSVVDPDTNPSVARRFGVSRYSTVVLQSGTRRVDVADPEELELSTGIIRLLRGVTPTVCVLTGHGEDDLADTSPTGYSQLGQLLSHNAYPTRALDLTTGAAPTVPADCAVVMIAGPRDPLLSQEVSALRAYAANAGRVLLLASPLSATDPNPLLEPLGAHFVGGLVVDPDHSVGADLSNLVIEDLPSASPVDEGVTRLHFPVSGGLSLSSRAGQGLTVEPLAVTGSASYLAPHPDSTLAEQPGDPHGRLAVAAAIDQSRVEDRPDPRLPPGSTGPGAATVLRTRVLVTSGDAWASNAFLDDLGNRRLLVNGLAWLTEQEQLVAATSRPNTARPLPLTPARQREILGVTVGAVPGTLVGIGVVGALLRRRRGRRAA